MLPSAAIRVGHDTAKREPATHVVRALRHTNRQIAEQSAHAAIPPSIAALTQRARRSSSVFREPSSVLLGARCIVPVPQRHISSRTVETMLAGDAISTARRSPAQNKKPSERQFAGLVISLASARCDPPCRFHYSLRTTYYSLPFQ